MLRQTVLVLVLIVSALSGAIMAAEAAEQSSPGRTIILFGADWCAPCVEELRELPGLHTAALPDRLIVAWTDGAARVPATLADAGVEQLSKEKARELLSRYGSGNAGLPLVVMTKDGARCATQRRRLTSEGIGALRKECDTHR